MQQFSTVGQRLRAARMACGITTEQAGVATNIAGSTISRYETGVIEGPRSNRLIALAELYHVYPLWILDGGERAAEDTERDKIVRFFLDQETGHRPVAR